jgi:hypothetical protein
MTLVHSVGVGLSVCFQYVSALRYTMNNGFFFSFFRLTTYVWVNKVAHILVKAISKHVTSDELLTKVSNMNDW